MLGGQASSPAFVTKAAFAEPKQARTPALPALDALFTLVILLKGD